MARWGLIVPEFNLANMSTPNLPRENPVGSNEIALFHPEKEIEPPPPPLYETRKKYISKVDSQRGGQGGNLSSQSQQQYLGHDGIQTLHGWNKSNAPMPQYEAMDSSSGSGF